MSSPRKYGYYFTRKDTKCRMDYRFGYKPTPDEACKWRIFQWWRKPDSRPGLVAHVCGCYGYSTKEEAEAVVKKFNDERKASMAEIGIDVDKL